MAETKSLLPSLPPEVLDIVASFGRSGQLLRTTCRELQEKTFDSFLKRYFVTRQVWIDRSSLNTLRDISEDARIGPTVRNVVISMHNYHHYARDNDDIVPKEVEEDEANQSLNEVLNEREEEQDFVLAHGYATLVLVGIMNKLISLKTLEISQIGHWTLVRPDEASRIATSRHLSNSMVRSGPPYPTSKLEYNDYDDMAQTIWRVVITALSTSNRRLSSFKMAGPGLSSLEALYFNIPRLQLGQLAVAFSNLKSLSLGLSITPSNEQHLWDSHLPKSFRSCLQILHLTLYVHDPGDCCGYDDTPFLDIVRALPVLFNLETLTIHNGMITSVALNDFLYRHKESLRSLSFHRICLLNGTWPSLKTRWANELLLKKLIIMEATHDQRSEDRTICNMRYSIEATNLEIQYVEGTLEEVTDVEQGGVGEDEDTDLADEVDSDDWGPH